MFGAQLSIKWFVVITKNGVPYYLKEEEQEGNKHKHVWTQKKDIAIKYTSSAEAESKVADVKRLHKDKKLIVKVV